MTKSNAILIIYDHLRAGKPCHVKDIVSLCGGISRRTALRYIKEIKDYLSEYLPEQTLVFDGVNDTYRIIHEYFLIQAERITDLTHLLPFHGGGFFHEKRE